MERENKWFLCLVLNQVLWVCFGGDLYYYYNSYDSCLGVSLWGWTCWSWRSFCCRKGLEFTIWTDLRGKGNNSEAILWQKHSHPPSSEAHLERTASSTAGAPRLAFPNPKNPCATPVELRSSRGSAARGLWEDRVDTVVFQGTDGHV